MATNKDVAQNAAKLKPSKAGSIRGVKGSEGSGRLCDADLSEWEEDAKLGIDFVVYSYATPIAWHTRYGWYFVREKFSVTTTKQQSLIRRIILEDLK